jgi:hypothetical protein
VPRSSLFVEGNGNLRERIISTQDNVASFLSLMIEAYLLQGPYAFAARSAGKFRHDVNHFSNSLRTIVGAALKMQSPSSSSDCCNCELGTGNLLVEKSIEKLRNAPG